MTRFVRRIGMATAAACALAGAAVLAQQQQPVFRAGVNLITVDAYPQQDGKVVPDLQASDFEVYEDGKLQKVETFNFVRIEPGTVTNEQRDPNTVSESIKLAADPANRLFVLYLDIYHVTIAGSHDIRQPLANVFASLMSPNDVFGMMTPLMRPKDIALGRVSTGIEEQLMKYWPWGQRDSINKGPEDAFLEDCFATDPGTGQPWMVNDGAAQRRLSDVMIARRREDATMASIENTMRYLGSLREARKSFLLISTGWILYQRDDAILGQITTKRVASMPGFQPCMQSAQSLLNIDDQQRMRELIDIANRNNVTFYPVSPGGLQTLDTPITETLGANTSVLGSTVKDELDRTRARSSSDRTLAENTDGIAVVDTNDLRRGLQRVMDDMSAYYLLGYYSTNTKTDGKYRHIEVKVKRSGVKMKARRGYVAPTEIATALSAGAAANAAAAASAAPSATEAALGSLARLDKSPEVLTYGVASGTELTVVVELATGQAERPGWAQGADAQVMATDAAGAALGTVKGRVEPGARVLSLRVPLGFGAGPWKVLVRVDGRDSSVDDRLEIKPPAGTVLGDALVFRGTPSAQSALRPVADLEFRRTERVHIEWPIVSSLDQRSARLLDRRGQPLPVEATMTERSATSGSVLAADVNLGPLAPADYLLEVTASHGADTERRLVAFRVIR